MAPPDNLNRIKPYFIIEIKIKNRYKRFLSQSFGANPSYVTFNGVELGDDVEVLDYTTATNLLESLDKQDKYYPWSSVVDVTSKRFVKG